MTDSIAQGIVSVHHVGMPWWVTIPVVAATVNFTIRLPIQLYAQKIRNERQKLQPLAYAWSTVIRREAENRIQARQMGPEEQAAERAAAWKKLGAKYKEMYAEFNCQSWKSFVPWVSMVPFVAFADAIRKIAGVSAFSGLQAPWAASTTDAQPEPLQLTEKLTALDPGLADGGILWFSDLSVADPYFALPIACSAVLAAQTWPKADPKLLFGKLLGQDPDRVETNLGRLQGIIQRGLVMVPFFPLLWTNLPSAVVLYALTTFSLTALNSFIAVRVYPKPVTKLSPMTKESDPSPFLHSGHVAKTRGEAKKA